MSNADVRFWHKADIAEGRLDVRFWGYSGYGDFRGQILLLTQTRLSLARKWADRTGLESLTAGKGLLSQSLDSSRFFLDAFTSAQWTWSAPAYLLAPLTVARCCRQSRRDQMKTQCLLRQNENHTTAWINAETTKLGLLVQIPGLDGRWEIVEIYPYRLTDKQLEMHKALIVS